MIAADKVEINDEIGFSLKSFASQFQLALLPDSQAHL